MALRWRPESWCGLALACTMCWAAACGGSNGPRGPDAGIDDWDGGSFPHAGSTGGAGNGGAGAGGGASPFDGGQLPTTADGGLPQGSGDDDVLDIPEADESFGVGGMATVNLSPFDQAQLWAVAVQSDGKLVIAGRTSEATFTARMNSTGELDSVFGQGGIRFAPFGQPVSTPGRFGDLVLDEDGSILVGSQVTLYPTADLRAILLRLTSSGSLDPSFGAEGWVMRDELGGPRLYAALALQTDGKILAGGHDTQLRLDRFLPSGALDADFGDAGSVRSPLGGEFASVLSIALRDDGRIITVGDYSEGILEPPHVSIAQLTPAGAFDSDFGAGAGYVIDPVAPGQGMDVAWTGDAIVVAGNRSTGGHTSGFAVGRYSETGMLDTGFGDGGWTTEDGTIGTADALALRPGGGILVAGYSQWAGSYAGLVCLDDDGDFDGDFGTDGLAEIAPGIVPRDVALDAQGRIITVGQSSVVRHHADGSHDTSFGTNGFSHLILPGTDRALAITVQDDGKLVVGGTAGVSGPGGLIRLDADGTLDETFGDGGRIRDGLGNLLSVTAVAVDAAGRVMLSGTHFASAEGLQVLRLNSSGALDTSFGVGGVAHSPAEVGDSYQTATMALAADGGIYVAGFAYAGTDVRLEVAKLLANGTPDAGFGTDGVASVALAGFTVNPSNLVLTVQSDGGVLVAGTAQHLTGATLARFADDGSLDTDFGEDGMVSVGGGLPRGITTDSDGRILVALLDLNATSLTLARFLESGTLDASFGDDGTVVEPLGDVGYFYGTLPLPVGLGVAPDGRVLIGAAWGEGGLRETALVLRYTSDGTRDDTFGIDGRLDLPLSTHSSSIHAIALQPDGRPLIAGRAWTRQGGSDFAVVRLH